MEFKLTKVENGYILQMTKWDILTGKPEQTITIHETLEQAIKYIEKNK